MPQSKTAGVLDVKGVEIHLIQHQEKDYISLTDMTTSFEGGPSLIEAWLRNKNTIEFLGVWELLNNPNFNSPEFEGIKNQAGLNRFTLSVKTWTQKIGGIGLFAKTGRYGGGTFAHKDIALEFASWLSPEFKLYLLKDFERLKQSESQSADQLEWSIRRTLAKAQYRVHVDAVRDFLIPKTLTEAEANFVFANEADLLNKALFGLTAKEWKTNNPNSEGNQRDNASIEQLIVLSSLESQNALLIEQGKPSKERLLILNAQAQQQLQSLYNKPLKKLQSKPLVIKK